MLKLQAFFIALRTWLENNKIFFDVTQSVLLGAMAVIISLYSLNISEKEHRLNSLKSLPTLKITVTPARTDNLEVYNTSNLEIYNEGERLSNFDCQLYTFLKVKQTCANCSGMASFQFQIDNFFSGTKYTNSHVGKLFTTISDSNNYKLITLKEEGASNRNKTYLIDLICLLKISYNDIEENQHVEYWIVNAINSDQITKSEFDNEFKANGLSKKGNGILNSYKPSLNNLKIKDIQEISDRTIPSTGDFNQ